MEVEVAGILIAIRILKVATILVLMKVPPAVAHLEYHQVLTFPLIRCSRELTALGCAYNLTISMSIHPFRILIQTDPRLVLGRVYLSQVPHREEVADPNQNHHRILRLVNKVDLNRIPHLMEVVDLNQVTHLVRTLVEQT